MEKVNRVFGIVQSKTTAETVGHLYEARALLISSFYPSC